MKHIHQTSAFLVKSGILRTSVYNVYGSQNDSVQRVTRVFILRIGSLGQNHPLRWNTVFAVARIEVQEFSCAVIYIYFSCNVSFIFYIFMLQENYTICRGAGLISSPWLLLLLHISYITIAWILTSSSSVSW